eukprot:CAMPEP_0183579774 /NCGR_PEP_ID=MMETSP0371-20130417/144507_1 /TAXON_ID=268820 /ORGANISM="Peridinium aciculiferum, Strain PAER-2" /LENGTH=52 /DNA_ID=CAMNT_0025790313 /DNA_START=1 /DNA_END=156 /DNA_ORIENTATION=-
MKAHKEPTLPPPTRAVASAGAGEDGEPSTPRCTPSGLPSRVLNRDQKEPKLL